LAADLPAVWDAPTTRMADRKQLLRLVIQEVRVTVTPPTSPQTAEVTILWSGGATTTHTVRCPPTGWHCVTDPTVVATIRGLARELPDYQIAERLNTQGVRTRTGKVWTHARVQSVRKHHQIPTACPVDPTDTPVRGDGLMSSAATADVLGVSQSLINYWIQQGIIRSEQRMAQSYQWLRLSPEEVARLDGKHDWSIYPTVRQVMRERGCSREALWELVRAGTYVPYRHPRGETWEWRLRLGTTSPTADEIAGVGNHTVGRHEKGAPQYG